MDAWVCRTGDCGWQSAFFRPVLRVCTRAENQDLGGGGLEQRNLLVSGPILLLPFGLKQTLPSHPRFGHRSPVLT